MPSDVRRNLHIDRLRDALAMIPQLREHHNAHDTEFRNWQNRTQQSLLELFGSEQQYPTRFRHMNFCEPRVSMGGGPPIWHEMDQRRYDKDISESEELLRDALEELEVNDRVDEEMAGSVGQPVAMIERLCDRFHVVVKQLGQRRENRPTLAVRDEYDVQDLMHALLRVFFDDIRQEEWTPSYAGKHSRMDFLLKQERIVVEIKMTRPGLGAKEVGDELIQDIARYQNHSDCQKLVCFVYDPGGYITNPSGIEADLSDSTTSLDVSVLVRPRGI